ncbi:MULTISPECIES: LPS translocon maturation chaperone LptM [unclassified Gilliamella]|jgi:predicted small lipoprotein YifL|uniref:LPS translocon maturation chaperone LptM n=1 Tax=unclassified Gilliamella TaxID=2685620 RepID=UPI00114651B4|nr:lipoprotein [Gilliamella apicola]
MKLTIKLLSIFWITLVLMGCGLKGPLYRPVETASIVQFKTTTTASIQSDSLIRKI